MRTHSLGFAVIFLVSGCLLAQAQTPVITSVLNSGTLTTGPIAPGENVTISGSNLGDATTLSCGSGGANPSPVPTVCGGVSVLVNGAPAPVKSEQAQQVTFLALITLTGTSATIQVSVTLGGGQTLQSAVANVTVAPTAPGLFTSVQNGVTYGNFADSSGNLITPSNPALPGSSVRALGTGFGVTSPPFTPGTVVPSSPAYNVVAPVTLTVGGLNATVTSAQLEPTSISGVDQVIFVVPANLSAGSHPLVVNVGGVNSQSLGLNVGSASGVTATIVSAVTDLSGGAKFCPGGQAIITGMNLGTNPNVTVGGKTAYNIVPPSNSGGTVMTIEIPVDAPLGSDNVVVTLGTGASNTPFPITLVQYAPVLPSTGPGSNLAQAYHLASQAPVTAAAPASPSEQIGLIAIGLGPTNPQLPTGATAQSPPPNTTTLPTVSVGGKLATGVAASATPGQVASYLVVFNVPASLATGSYPVTVTIGGVTSNTENIPVSTAPYVSSVTNAASGIVAPLPNSGIAQGAIFTVFGGLLGPANISIAANAFQSTTLSGTSMSVSVAGATVSPLMYYTSAGQVAALLPSNTPTGPGTITVTYNGQTGQPAPINVVQNNLGIFTVTSDGEGAGIVTYPDYSLVSVAKAANCGGPSTTCGAANPGDTLILWATGLGPVNGSDASGAGLGVNQTNIPLTVWLGGVQAPVLYQGRSGCCIGEDQIVFTVPNNVPTGCAVPLSIQINSEISNNVVMPIAIGSRTCTPTNPVFTAAVLQLSGNGPTSFSQIALNRQDNYPNGLQDIAKVTLGRFTVAPAYQPFFVSYIDDPPPGTCLVSNSLNHGNPPFATETGIDAGTQLTINGPNGNQNVPLSGGGESTTTLSQNGSYLSAGTYTVSNGSGGADVKGFSGTITIPTLPAMTSPQPDTNNQFSVNRSSGLPVTWSGGTSSAVISLSGESATDNTFNTGAAFQCSLSASAGTFTVPPYVLLALPAGSFGGMDFHPGVIPVTFSATGLSLGFLSAQRDYSAFLTLK